MLGGTPEESGAYVTKGIVRTEFQRRLDSLEYVEFTDSDEYKSMLPGLLLSRVLRMSTVVKIEVTQGTALYLMSCIHHRMAQLTGSAFIYPKPKGEPRLYGTHNIKLWNEEAELFSFYNGLMKLRKFWNQSHLDQLYQDLCFALEVPSFTGDHPSGPGGHPPAYSWSHTSRTTIQSSLANSTAGLQ